MDEPTSASAAAAGYFENLSASLSGETKSFCMRPDGLGLSESSSAFSESTFLRHTRREESG